MTAHNGFCTINAKKSAVYLALRLIIDSEKPNKTKYKLIDNQKRIHLKLVKYFIKTGRLDGYKT